MAGAVILLCVTLLNVFLTPKKYRTLTNPSIAFSALWTFIVFLAAKRLLRLYPTSDDGYMAIIAGVTAFSIGGALACLLRHVKTRKPQPLYDGPVRIRYEFLMVLEIVCILYYMPGLLKSVSLMAGGMSLNDVRSLIQGSEYSQGLRNLIPNYVILPISISLEVIAVVDFWKGGRNRIFIFMTLILVILRILGDGGRTPLFNIVLYFIVLYSMMHRDEKEKGIKNRKNKRIFIIAVTAGVLLLAAFTLMRTGRTAYRKLYFYFSMAPVLLSSWIDSLKSTGYLAYGAVSFNGILYFADYIIKNLTGSGYEPFIINAYNMVASTDSSWIKIAPTTTANAYVSCFTFFYADGGMTGVVLLSLLYGFFMCRCFYNVRENRDNLCQTACYMFLFQGLFFSFIRFPFVKAYYILALILIRFIAFKRGSAPSLESNES